MLVGVTGCTAGQGRQGQDSGVSVEIHPRGRALHLQPDITAAAGMCTWSGATAAAGEFFIAGRLE